MAKLQLILLTLKHRPQHIRSSKHTFNPNSIEMINIALALLDIRLRRTWVAQMSMTGHFLQQWWVSNSSSVGKVNGI